MNPDLGHGGRAQSIIGLYKTEAITTDVFHTGPFKTLVDGEYAAAGWVDWWNHRRLHSSTGQIPPAEHEHDYYAALNRGPHPV
ncbi:integrase core domain-containing protein [Nocardioides acrostichi]|uniref:Transposase n=1 Tax=Nocardioides acrostichi TaxID=2784339 RepID=A0A930Y5M7_9ACTN|nr:integrase core domain-containing protein [Nocardioides acrostichi]MBF4160057.1 transposase [Nocardioides acrostichi]